ncbi:MAG: MerR family transcriptional regulator [Lachnospiraceae bacterium]|nr:MerR family transcriptional regulator [Lachnospiraceae bacterium]
MKEFYTIGEICKIFNIPSSTLRYYDSINLLSPWTTGENGYRYYSKAQFEIISMIGFMRSLGTPLKRLKKILSEGGPEGICAELRRNEKEIDERMEELQLLKQKVTLYEDIIAKTCSGPVFSLEDLPQMYLMCKPFGDKDELDVEEIIKVTRGSARWADTAGIFSTISRDDLEKGNFHTYEKYGYISELPYPKENRYTEVLAAGRYACGSMRIKTVEHFEADDFYRRLLDFVKDRGLTVTGPAIERNVLDIYGNDPMNPTMYFRVYIPVSKKYP